MGKILVLNIDRDDDLGRKAGVASPVIGRKDNLEAAEKLALQDPEDTDVNAIFSAISLYDKLLREGRKVEVATICGDISVGIKSDQILAEQLEVVLKKTGAEEVILVTDGAEDEYILPIVQSRIKITSIQRVTVKQSKTAEDAYYRLTKLLDDEKIKKHFLLPLSLILVVWSVFALLNMASVGVSAIIFVLGLYLLVRAMKWERGLAVLWEEMKSSFLTGRVSIYTYIVAIFIVIGSIIYSYRMVTLPSSPPNLTLLHFIIAFLKNVIWGIVGAGLLATLGRAIDMKVKEKKTPWRYWTLPFSLLSFGFIGTAITNALYEFLNSLTIEPFLRLSFLAYLALGILIATVGAITYRYIKEAFMVDVEHDVQGVGTDLS